MMFEQLILSTERHSATSTFQTMMKKQVFYFRRKIQNFFSFCNACISYLSFSLNLSDILNMHIMSYLYMVYIDLLAGNICNRDVLAETEAEDEIVNVDDKYMDPQLCATFACDIYKHLRASEVC
jgi:hypothetical protein